MRKYYIDNLRWITILMLIPYHAAMAWNVWGEPNYIYYKSSQVISSIVVFLSPYFMPLMFLIAGISARYALQKRTIGQYVLERARKLLVPFITGTILIMPLMTYIADRFNYGYQGGLLQHYTVFFTRFTDLTGSDSSFSVGQFWFLLYLFVMSLITAGIVSLQGKSFPEKMQVYRWRCSSSGGCHYRFLADCFQWAERVLQNILIFSSPVIIFSQRKKWPAKQNNINGYF